MSPDYKDQLNRLQKVAPTIEAVYEALKQPELDAKVVWAYYYPLSLGKAYWFFGGEQNEEIANQAAFELVEHLVGNALPLYNEEVAKLSPFYNRVALNFFINYKEREVLKEPPIFYGHDEETIQDPMPFYEDYPYDGIEENFVVGLMDQEGSQEKIDQLKADLFPAEQAVLELLVQGLTYAEIAVALGKTQTAIYNSIRKITSLIES